MKTASKDNLIWLNIQTVSEAHGIAEGMWYMHANKEEKLCEHWSFET